MYPNLKLQIFKQGVHQNHIARALRIDESVLSKIIHGYREPSEGQRKQLADFLRVEETWLFEKYNGVPQRSEQAVDVRVQAEKDSVT
jgi:transcriptional regulator with XRE-family HTH domain